MKKLITLISLMFLLSTSVFADTLTVEIEIPQGVVSLGGVELFASAYGWTPKVVDPTDDTKEIDNPLSAEDASKEIIKAFFNEVTYAKFKASRHAIEEVKIADDFKAARVRPENIQVNRI